MANSSHMDGWSHSCFTRPSMHVCPCCCCDCLLLQIKFLVQWAATNHEPGEQVSGALKDELVNMLLSGQLGQGEEGDAEMGAEEGDAGEQQQVGGKGM